MLLLFVVVVVFLCALSVLVFPLLLLLLLLLLVLLALLSAMRARGVLRLRSAAKMWTAQYTIAMPTAIEPNRDFSNILRMYANAFHVIKRDRVIIARQYVTTLPACGTSAFGESDLLLSDWRVGWVRVGELGVCVSSWRCCKSCCALSSLAVCSSVRHVVQP